MEDRTNPATTLLVPVTPASPRKRLFVSFRHDLTFPGSLNQRAYPDPSPGAGGQRLGASGLSRLGANIFALSRL